MLFFLSLVFEWLDVTEAGSFRAVWKKSCSYLFLVLQLLTGRLLAMLARLRRYIHPWSQTRSNSREKQDKISQTELRETEGSGGGGYSWPVKIRIRLSPSPGHTRSMELQAGGRWD